MRLAPLIAPGWGAADRRRCSLETSVLMGCSGGVRGLMAGRWADRALVSLADLRFRGYRFARPARCSLIGRRFRVT